MRERRTDVPLLAAALLKQINEQFAATEPGYRHKSLSKSAVAFVRKHHWRGIVRQLHNALVQAAVMCDGEVLKPGDLAAATFEQEQDDGADWLNTPIGEGFSLDRHLDEIRRHFLTRAMDEADGVLAKAAKLLGMKHYQTLDGQLERSGIDKRQWK